MPKFPFFKRRTSKTPAQANLGRSTRILGSGRTRERIGSSLKSDGATISLPADYGFSERITLYRFLRENIPIVSGAIWVWVRLCASPMMISAVRGSGQRSAQVLKSRLDKLSAILTPNSYYKSGGLERLCDLFFSSLFVDGAFAGSLEIDETGNFSGFSPCDIRNLTFERDSENGQWRIYHESAGGS